MEVGAENILVLAALTSVRCIYAKQSVSALSLSSLGRSPHCSFNKTAIQSLSRWFSERRDPPLVNKFEHDVLLAKNSV